MYKTTELYKSLKVFFIYLVLSMSTPAFAQEEISLQSPDKNILFSFVLSPEGPKYKVDFRGGSMLDLSSLDMQFRDGIRFDKLSISTVTTRDLKEEYDLVVGKAKHVMSHCNEQNFLLQERSGGRRKINFIVRVYNDGVAFRYEFPKQVNWTSYVLEEERTGFQVYGNPKVTTLFRPGYNTSHEGLYDHLQFKDIKEDSLMDMPALFEMESGAFMAITEAALVDYAGMYLVKKGQALVSQLSPLPGQQDIKVKATLPHKTPWRVMMISDKIGDLISSNILTNLNEPQKIKDVSWIKPGKTSFHWWNGDIMPDTSFAPGVNFKFNKYYIDFCARNKINYHAVIGYGGFSWYKNDGAGYSVIGPNTDVTQPVAGLDMQQVCDYARQQGVGIHVWVNWKAIYPQLEKSFTQFEKWGVKGMMVDFLNRDDQEMVNIQREILKKAAEHKLYIQFHGSYKPTGLHRTYPNEFTREGSYNYETNKSSKKPVSPEHDLDIVFTRMLAGATDYHLGGFRAVPAEDFRPHYIRPFVVGTRSHMLSMYVVLESYLVSLCDYPQAYEGQPGFEFLQKVPTVWDETKVLQAAVGKYISIARRSGEDWYVGTINNSATRTLPLDLSFLPAGEYSATVYSDAGDAALNPDHVLIRTIQVNNTKTINIDLASGGGHAMQLIKNK